MPRRPPSRGTRVRFVRSDADCTETSVFADAEGNEYWLIASAAHIPGVSRDFWDKFPFESMDVRYRVEHGRRIITEVYRYDVASN